MFFSLEFLLFDLSVYIGNPYSYYNVQNMFRKVKDFTLKMRYSSQFALILSEIHFCGIIFCRKWGQTGEKILNIP